MQRMDRLWYRRTFSLPAAWKGKRVLLHFGAVDWEATVSVNGKELGIAWRRPFRVEVTGALRSGRNELEIRVTNLWVNRLIGDAALPESQRVARSHVVFRPDQPLLSSGLLGPVTIESYKEKP